MNPGDTFMGLSLVHGGHLTRGSAVTISGKWVVPVEYVLARIASALTWTVYGRSHSSVGPKLLLLAAQPIHARLILLLFVKIADEIGAKLMVDMAHVAGLVAGGVYPPPVPYAHVIASTTHKTLREPRGA